MKKLLWASIIVVIAGVMLPALLMQLGLSVITPIAAETPKEASLSALVPVAAETGGATDAETAFTALIAGESRSVTMAEYLPHAVAAEMPASFNFEALKAQAVAARTYVLYCTAHENPVHPDSAVCSDSGCCLAFNDDDAMRGAWGAQYEENLALIKKACQDTDGVTIHYGGEPVLAAFHSSSNGKTEDGAALWGDVPYLKSVDSPETGENVPEYVTTVEVSALNFKETVLMARPEADFSGWPEEWLGGIEYDESGRMKTLTVGGVVLSGNEVRNLFSLRSTAFALECRERVFFFTVTGFGHGLGMSQYGADVLARQGYGYKEILEHYYTNTEIF